MPILLAGLARRGMRRFAPVLASLFLLAGATILIGVGHHGARPASPRIMHPIRHRPTRLPPPARLGDHPITNPATVPALHI